MTELSKEIDADIAPKTRGLSPNTARINAGTDPAFFAFHQWFLIAKNFSLPNQHPEALSR